MNDKTLTEILGNNKVIAVVGFSVKPDRPSHYVSHYMHSSGYTILPINPGHGGQPSGLGNIPVYASVADAVSATGLKPGIVNVFRRSEDVGPAVTDAISAGAAAVWMQQGVFNEAEAARAEAAGLKVVMDLCIKLEHRRLIAHA
jgi:predicted CoA-binding protein